MSYRTWRAGADWAVLVDVAETRGYVYRDITTFRRTGGGYRRSHEHHRLRVFPRRQWSGCFGPMAFPSGVSRRYGDLELPPRRLAFIVRKG